MKTFKYLILLFLFSCSDNINSDIRMPFEVNHEITPKILFSNGYQRIWGEDVILYGKNSDDENVYYQIDIPELKGDIKNERDYIKMLENDGIISFKNYQKELSDKDYEVYKNSINSLLYKTIETKHKKSDYLKDQFYIINLKTKDTFRCSYVNMDNKLLFQSSVLIKK